jgi:hypothetical protein
LEFFISHKILEAWSEEGKAALEADSLKLEGRGASRSLTPAIHIVSLVSGEDGRQYVGTVRTEEEIAKMGGELYFDSLLVDEDAYTVERGFLAGF